MKQLLEIEAHLMSLVPSHDAPDELGTGEGTKNDFRYHLLPAPIGGDFHHDTLDISLQPLTF